MASKRQSRSRQQRQRVQHAATKRPSTQREQTWVNVDTLTNDPRFQRPLHERTVRMIVDHLDPDALGVIYVSQRPDGTLVLLDGQHRVEAVIRALGHGQQVPALIYHGLSLADEAKLWAEFNENRVRPRPSALHHAAVTGGDPDALKIEQIISAHDLFIADGLGPSRIQAVSTLYDVLHNAGPAVLDRMLVVTINAWGAHTRSFRSDTMRATAVVISRHPWLDDKHLAKRLARETPDAVVARAQTIRSALRVPAASAIGHVIVSRYNFRYGGRKVQWNDDAGTGVGYWLPADVAPERAAS